MTDSVRHHTSVRIPVTAERTATWRATPEDREAHAFADSGPGWTRSACRKVHFTFRLQRVADDFPRCRDCWLLIDGAPGEISEAWGS